MDFKEKLMRVFNYFQVILLFIILIINIANIFYSESVAIEALLSSFTLMILHDVTIFEMLTDLRFVFIVILPIIIFINLLIGNKQVLTSLVKFKDNIKKLFSIKKDLDDYENTEDTDQLEIKEKKPNKDCQETSDKYSDNIKYKSEFVRWTTIYFAVLIFFLILKILLAFTTNEVVNAEVTSNFWGRFSSYITVINYFKYAIPLYIIISATLFFRSFKCKMYKLASKVINFVLAILDEIINLFDEFTGFINAIRILIFKKPDNSDYVKILMYSAGALSLVSWWTTAKGLESYAFINNSYPALFVSFGVQSILLFSSLAIGSKFVKRQDKTEEPKGKLEIPLLLTAWLLTFGISTFFSYVHISNTMTRDTIIDDFKTEQEVFLLKKLDDVLEHTMLLGLDVNNAISEITDDFNKNIDTIIVESLNSDDQLAEIKSLIKTYSEDLDDEYLRNIEERITMQSLEQEIENISNRVVTLTDSIEQVNLEILTYEKDVETLADIIADISTIYGATANGNQQIKTYIDRKNETLDNIEVSQEMIRYLKEQIISYEELSKQLGVMYISKYTIKTHLENINFFLNKSQFYEDDVLYQQSFYNIERDIQTLAENDRINSIRLKEINFDQLIPLVKQMNSLRKYEFEINNEIERFNEVKRLGTLDNDVFANQLILLILSEPQNSYSFMSTENEETINNLQTDKLVLEIYEMFRTTDIKTTYTEVADNNEYYVYDSGEITSTPLINSEDKKYKRYVLIDGELVEVINDLTKTEEPLINKIELSLFHFRSVNKQIAYFALIFALIIDSLIVVIGYYKEKHLVIESQEPDSE